MAMMVFLLVVTTILLVVSGENTSFIFHEFRSANLTMDGLASVTPNGLLQLTNHETKLHMGHAFYPYPLVFTNSSSFSTTFIFAIIPLYPSLSGDGMAFVMSPTKELVGARPSQHLGLFNETNNGDSENHVFAVEFDTIQNFEFRDTNDNHVGIDINGLNSSAQTTARYNGNGSGFQNLTLASGFPMQVWVYYDGGRKQINVTLAPINVDKPKTPLLSLSKDLSLVLTNSSYVGFSSSAGSFLTSHYVLGWSFKLNGDAQNLDLSGLPKLPRVGGRTQSMILPIGLSLLSLCLLFLVSSSIVYYLYRKRKFSEVVEEWEQEYGPHRFKYKDLYIATNGFKEKELLGSGGFGRVYKGTITGSKTEVAVKKVSHDSRQGMKEFIAEIVSIGLLRHRNLVSLLGYCRRKGELLLVYDLMPNGSLDKYLFNQPSVTLNWTQRFRIIKGIASGLCYLHEEWEQVVVHRDVKASNVLLDSEFNGRLGDFGLARLYDHGSDPATTNVMGTLGYLAPENTRTGRATTKSDVFAFGAFMLEVVCGRRPIELGREEFILVDCVYELWRRGEIVEARDQNLGTEYKTEEVELVLKLGLLCSNSKARDRPNMRQVVQYLNTDMPLPDFSSLMSSRSCFGVTYGISFASSSAGGCSSRTSISESLLSGGR